MKLVLPYLEVMATQSCNLSCLGCTNYSDLPAKGFVSWQEIKNSLLAWGEKLEILDFGIIGGEPLLNPEIEDWILGIRQLLPNSQIRLVTNGLLLDKKFHILDLLHEIGNCVFEITVHQNNQKLEETIQNVFKKYNWSPITEYNIDRWTTGNQFRFQVGRPNTFIKTYKNFYENMMPYSNNPADAFEICCQKTCPLLYQGKIYKCSTSALLQTTLNRVGNPNAKMWEPYIEHGIDVSDSDAVLSKFVANFGKPNKICRMCPTKNDLQSQIDHLENVSRKKYKLKK